MKDIKEIKSFVESGAGAKMKEYLQLRLTSLRSIERVRDLDDPVELAVDIKAQKKAYFIIRDILDDIMIVESEDEATGKPEEDNLIPGLEED